MMAVLSIVICCFNKKNFTLSCLRDLAKLDPVKHQIVLIDNASSDGTEEDVKKLNLKNLFYYKNDDNLGFGKACNQGYYYSLGDSVLFLNNDIKVKSNFESWTDTILNNLRTDVLVGPTGGLVDKSNDFSFVYETNDSSKNINYMSGWCLAAYKSTFDKLVLPGQEGPFDSKNFFCFYEDTDLGFRAKKSGVDFKLIELPLVHFGHITSNSIGTSKYYNESRKKFISKWKK